MLTGKRWSVISKEMKDYVCGYYGKAPGNMDKEIVAKVAGDAEILDPKIAPGTLVTTTYDAVSYTHLDVYKRQGRGRPQVQGRAKLLPRT